MKQIGYFIFLLINAFPSTVSTSYALIPPSYCLDWCTNQNKKLSLSEMLSAGLWIPGSCFGERKSLTVRVWRCPTLLSWYHCWARNAVKDFFLPYLLRKKKNYLRTASVLLFFLIFFSIYSFYIMSKLLFLFVACVLIAVELWTGTLGG